MQGVVVESWLPFAKPGENSAASRSAVELAIARSYKRAPDRPADPNGHRTPFIRWSRESCFYFCFANTSGRTPA